MRGTLLTPLLAAGLLVLTGCEDWGDWGPSDRYKEDFHHSYAMKPGGTLSMENFNGPVEIMSWEQDTVEINGTKHASQRSYLDEMKIDVSATPGAVRIRTLRPSLSHCNCGARYSIRVPRRVMLDEIVSSNGGIRIDRIEGNARVRTSNGGVRIDGLTGDLNARTSNGSIEIRDLDGSARVHTSNGSIDAEATHGSFEAETSNGRIEVTLVEPGADWPMRLTTSNGHIELTMKGNKLPDVRASTSNSSVVVHLPASVNARVRAATSHHNNITTDFNELLRSDEEDDRRRRRSEVEGRLGSGGPLIDLSTSNGPIKILKL
jgi:DUF4097 and DUF4098 domain-containing protein YvlB